MKIGWGLTTNRDALWTNVIRGKYRCGTDLIPNINMKRTGSRLWSGIKSTWEQFREGVEIQHSHGQQRVRWKYERHGQFSIKSAYDSIANNQRQGTTNWSKLWKISCPQRCKMHLWLLMHDRLLTNDSLRSKGLHPNGLCTCCQTSLETTIHVMRDCIQARQVWLALGVSPDNHHFWSSSLESWICSNIWQHKMTEYGRWRDLFGITCWILWRRRNERVHHMINSSVHEGLAEIKGILRCTKYASEFKAQCQKTLPGQNHGTTCRSNESSGMEVYVDGASSFVTHSAGCGGIIRNPDGEVIESFMCRIDGNDCCAAELWGCILGLRRAWDGGFKKVKMFCDSTEVIRLSLSSDNELHADKDLITELQELLSREWDASLHLIDRWSNIQADALVKQALNMGFGLQILFKESTWTLLDELEVT